MTATDINLGQLSAAGTKESIMRVFVTGASGWIGSAVVAELLAAGHQVTGLARSDASAEAITAAGATVLRGSLDDLEGLRAAAEASEGVVHLGFKHDFSDMAGAGRTERAVIETFGAALEGTDRPLLFASGVAMLAPGRVVTENDANPTSGPDAPRGGAENLAFSYAERGIRPVSLRFSPTVHGEGDHGFMAVIAGIARQKGVAAFIGDGSNRWPAVHRSDAARLVRLALEKAPAGSAVHAVGEEGIAARDISAAIAEQLGIEAVSIAPDAAAEHFGWMSHFWGVDMPASSMLTRELLDWAPTGPTLLDDITAGHYTR